MVGGLCCYLTGPSFQWILLVWTFNIFFYLYWSGAHSSSDTSEAQCFAMFFRLNYMFPGNGVQRGLTYVFSYFVGKKCQPNQQQQINHAVLKRQLAQWVQVKSFPNVSCSSVYPTIEDIKSNQITFIVTSPQHMRLGEWNSWERAPDSAETIYI